MLHPATFVLAVVLASNATAQLKLPHRPREDTTSGGSLAPYRVCGVCSARNYTHPPSGRVDAQGRELAWCDACHRDTPQSFGTATAAAGPGIPDATAQGGLKLPRTLPPQTSPANPPPAPATTPPAPVRTEPAPLPPSESQGAMTPAAAFVFAEVAKLDNAESGTAQRAVESLLAMRAAGLEASRIALFDERAAPIVVAARVLLRGAVAADADLVVRRLRAKLPAGAGAPLLRAVVEEDPVRATPELFAALLEHVQAAVRNAASRELRARLDESLLPHLEPVLASTRAESRGLALELVASVPGTRATAAVLTRLDDPNARVASAAVGALRTRDDEGLDMELVRRAFRSRWILRPNAYALLAILEREDAGLRPILLDEHVEPLLESMGSSDPFLSGTCAAALAGLGFRSQRADVSAWLDGPVVDRLVLAVSGKVFHDDYSSLVGPAVRRLRLLSGTTIAQDGPAWVDWWVGAREGFHARRASLSIRPGEEGSIRLAAYSPASASRTRGDAELDVELFGPDAPAPAPSVTDGRRDRIRLTAQQAAEVAAALVQEGVLAASRMPGAYSSAGRDDRTLTIEVQGRAKSFSAGPRANEPWFEKLLSLATALREQNRWQLLVTFPEAGADSAAWDAEAAWWAAAHTELERGQRLAGLSFAALESASLVRRERALDELERVAVAGALPAEALIEVLQALRREANPGETARRLARLAIRAGRPGDAPLEPATAQRLLDTSLATFGLGAGDVLDLVLAASDRAFVRRAASDEHPAVRRAAIAALGRNPDAEDANVLVARLDDPDPRVSAAAAEALGTAKVERAREDLLSRARLAQGPMRPAALRAAGSLGGPFVLDALVLGLGDPDLEVRRAAVDGLGRLADPAAAQVLVNVLQETSDAPLRDAARAALARIGPEAVTALKRAADQQNGRARREAALALSELLAPEAVPALLQIATQDANDKQVQQELAILSCIDPRGTTHDPANAWWSWWEGVRHDDSLVWFRAGVERLGLAQPPVGALEGHGTNDGRRFLLGLLEHEESWLVERAWRELRRLFGADLGAIPPRGAARAQWVREQRAAIAAQERTDGTPR